MTLLELLRQELPKRGGWPEGANFIAQDSYGCTSPGKIYAYENKPKQCETYWFNGDNSSGYGNFVMKSEIIAEDSTTAIVTREQYGWDGTGLPPVGCEIEYVKYQRGHNDDWFIGTINYISDFTVVISQKGHKGEIVGHPVSFQFRPIRTEVERAIDEMVQLSGVSTGAAKILYDAGYRK